MEDFKSIFCYDDKIFIGNDSNHREISKDEFGALFPTLAQTKSGKFIFISCDRRMVIPLDELGDEFLSTLTVSESILNRFKHYGRGQNNDLFELIKKNGLEKEYCLVFGGKIMFHSPSKEEVEKYKKSHSGIAFVSCGPF